MRQRLLALAVERETDIVLARQRTREIAGLIGFDRQDQTRITTAVSEVVRNALDYGGGGRVEYWFSASPSQQTLEMVVQDRGPGIADIDTVLRGAYRSSTGMGIGITGARRLMDDFAIETAPGKGTRVVLTKHLPARARAVAKNDLARVGQRLAQSSSVDANEEIRLQNREMLVQLEELNERQQELQQLNQELQDTNRGVVALYAELDERADHLRRADELKSRFLSNMSHEFRTPLNSIVALARLLLTQKDGPLSADQQKQVHFIVKAAETLSDLVNDLLDIARVEAGKTVVAPVEFRAADLFGALRGMLRPLLVGDAVALLFEDVQDLEPLFTDEGKVSQILRNFISNALKFTERGEVRVWAEEGPEAGLVTFHVRDTGIGIAQHDQQVIWQEFGQVAHPLQSRVKGTGLGLPLSKRLAELLGGSVAVQSAPALGSTFSLTLPRIYPLPAQGSGIGSDWTLQPGKIPVLVVDDNPADSFALERALAASPYQALTAGSTAQARAAMQRLGPKAILLDIFLGGEETWRFLVEVKQNDEARGIPVIVVSSTYEEARARSLGADDYLSKPADPIEIVLRLDRALGRASVRRVLVVDDDEMTRYLVRQLLPGNSFQIVEAATGQDALDQAEHSRPDVVLVDLNMPLMNGYEFLERWWGMRAKAAPAIVLTSMPVGPEQRRGLGNVSQVVAKSDLSSETLMRAIDAAIAGAGPAAS